ncbi:MAG TPA: hypothetical protein VG452_08380, partial [Egibacteraceae bacterium]|nr:hypothetical protein [Egibacteraceae bacterium]
DWMYVATPLWVYGVCVLALFGAGRTEFTGNPVSFFFRQISDSLQRLTGFPGWSMAGVLSGLMMLLIAVLGFYWDVAWHIDHGRDEQLFTPSHVMIVVGLAGLVFAAAVSAVFATLERAGVGFSALGLRVPWSALSLGVMGAGALGAFPLDNLWHQAYGLDVTLWSPTHLQLVGGGALATLAVLLMIAEALPGARPTAVGRAVMVMAAGAALVGMTTFQGEFDFGVPQFQVVYLPILIAAAAAFTLVFARFALGRWGALKATAFYLLLRGLIALVVAVALNHTFPRFPLYLPSALAVEAAAVTLGTGLRLRFALAAGALVGTVGLAGELAWTVLSGYGPSSPALLPKIAVLAPAAALAGAMLGAGLGRAFSAGQQRIPAAGLVLAGVVLAAALAVPLPRSVGRVQAAVRLDRTDGMARVEVQLHPPDAARDATAFAVSSWQGGGRVTAALTPVGPGRYVSSQPVPVSGRWKTVVALNRGDEVMAAPVHLPADPDIGAAAIPAVPERRVSFVRNTDLLLREAHGGPPLPAALAYGGWGASVALWVGLMAVTATRAQGRHRHDASGQPARTERPSSPGRALGTPPDAAAAGRSYGPGT